MHDKAQNIADAVTHTGAVVATGSFLTLRWWNDNSAAVVAICGVVGALASVIGLCISWYYKHKRANKERADG